MKDFSKINLTTGKDHLIEEMVIATGLPKENITKLYENFDLYSNGDIKEIKNKFKSFINVDFDNLDTFLSKVTNIPNEIKDKNKFVLSTLVSCNFDDSSFFKAIGLLLYQKNPENFSKVNSTLTLNLMESVNVDKIIGISDNSNVEESKEFYQDLKTILSKNNRRWGYNYHLDNVYSTIMDYLNNEITEIVNKDNVNTITDRFEETLIQELLNGGINPMYRDINTLRTLIPDIQTLVFDMFALSFDFIMSNSYYIQYISQDSLNQYISASKNLYAGISTSAINSKVIDIDANNKSIEESVVKNNLAQFVYNLRIKSEYVNWYTTIKYSSIVDMIYIIKSCSVDFNLKTRPALRDYVTKSFEILAKLEKIILEHRKIK